MQTNERRGARSKGVRRVILATMLGAGVATGGGALAHGGYARGGGGWGGGMMGGPMMGGSMMGGPIRSVFHEAKLARMLDLTPEQRRRMRDIVTEAREAAMPLADELLGLRESMHEGMLKGMRGEGLDEEKVRRDAARMGEIMGELMVIGARTRTKMAALLTPEQQEKMEKMKRIRHEGGHPGAGRHRGMMGGMMGPGGRGPSQDGDEREDERKD